MMIKNKKLSLLKKFDTKIDLIKIARESKKERLWRLSWSL